MSDPVFVGSGLGKRYRIRDERSLARRMRDRRPPRELWALRDVSLEVAPGEVLAVIGRNGAGKSTLLKMAAGVTTPTTGTIRRPDRVAPLIEVGAGFHPELTGRDNVALNARLLGLSPRRTTALFDDIVEFAELAHAIDQPVRQYSSGMYMRLGFAVAVHTDPELLVVDEVLAVGDLPFQMRCLDRIRALRDAGAGVLFVSHNLAAVLNLAGRALLVEGGRAIAEGEVEDVVGAYHLLLAERSSGSSRLGEDAVATGEVHVESITVRRGDGGAPRSLWRPGDRVRLDVEIAAPTGSPEALVGFRLVREGTGAVGGWMGLDGPFVPALPAGGTASVQLDLSLNVAEGAYSLDLAFAPPDMSVLLYNERRVVSFGVGPRPGGTGIADLAPALEVRATP